MSHALGAETFYELSFVTEVALSPDGERIAHVVHEFGPDEDQRRTSLFVVPADGSDDSYRLTRASSASTPKWSPDGGRLGFLATRDTDTALQVGPSEDGEDASDENDWRCPPTQAEQLYVSGRTCGVDAKLVVYRDENHDVSNPERAIHRLKTLTSWFADHDDGAAQGDTEGDGNQ